MTNTELLAILRVELDDTVPTYLWSDPTLYGFIDDAQKWFCRLTYGIADARSFTVAIAVATSWYSVDPKILKLRAAIDRSTGLPVPLVALENMANRGLRFDGTSGPVRALITGMEKGKLRACPIPNVAGTVDLHTFRLPEDMAEGDDFEIEDQHVLPLMMWVKHRAYNVRDTEVYDPKLATQCENDFRAYCARALDEQSRLNHTAGTVAYGGI